MIKSQLHILLDTNLLQATGTNALFRLMKPENLLVASEFMALAIISIVVAIYIHLFYKKQQYFYTVSINRHLESWISHLIIEESSDSIQLPAKFYRILKNEMARHAAIAELINCKKNFSGMVADNIVQLYLQLGLKKDSMKKIASPKWWVKARGIQELYLMDQMDVLKPIYKNTNNRNEFVRMEAQTGVINMTGFLGLRFLDVVSYPVTEWQQIKLLEQLRLTPDKEDISGNIPGWLRSKNDSVVVFALKLADDYLQLKVTANVVECLAHPNEKVRAQAVRTLLRFEDPDTADVLIASFDKEEFQNRALILDALNSLATEAHTGFLTGLLYDENNTIKLKAAEVLARCSPEGISILEAKATLEPEPFERILKHVKSVK